MKIDLTIPLTLIWTLVTCILIWLYKRWKSRVQLKVIRSHHINDELIVDVENKGPKMELYQGCPARIVSTSTSDRGFVLNIEFNHTWDTGVTKRFVGRRGGREELELWRKISRAKDISIEFKLANDETIEIKAPQKVVDAIEKLIGK